MKIFLLVALAFFVAAGMYQAKVIKQQKDLINAMWLDKHVPCENDNTEYQKQRSRI